jgi:hypothetical protein
LQGRATEGVKVIGIKLENFVVKYIYPIVIIGDCKGMEIHSECLIRRGFNCDFGEVFPSSE